MVVQKIKDIDPKKLKKAQGAIALLELLGITEEDLLKIKDIPAMEQELADLREFKTSVIRTLDTKTASNKKPTTEALKDAFNQEIKEFNPHYAR